MNIEKELPKGWKITKLADFVKSQKGKKPRYVSTEKSNEYNIPYVNIKAFEKNIIDEYTNGVGCVFCEEDDFLMVWDGSRSGYVGRAVKGAIGSTLVKLSFPSEVFEKYAYYYLQSKYIEINTRAKGVGIPHVDPNLVWNYRFLLPPLVEQYHIVDKIEELFSELDKGIENLKTAQQQLKVYRQTVLKWAFLNDKFKEYIAKDITEKIQIGPFGTQLHKEDYIENGIPLINPTHIKDGVIVADKSFTILESKRESLPNYILNEGDVIMGRRGEMARCGLVSIKEAGWFCGTGSLYFRPNLKLVDPVFLYHKLRSEPVKKYLEENAGGTTMANLNLKIVNGIPISIPSIEEQKAIVLELESRLSVCDKMEETIITSLQQAEALRQSILKKAFEGKLVIGKKQPAENQKQIVPMVDNWKRKVLVGNIVYSFQTGGYIGRTKLQKILYLCEQHAQLDYETNYFKEAAGPLDSKFFYSFLNEAKRENWIEETSIGGGYKYEPSVAISKLTLDYPKYFKADSEKIKFVIKLLKDKDTDTSELIATIYAIWNNFIIEHLDLTNELLISEVYDWDSSKIKFDKRLIKSTWQWMKEEGLVPVGFGKIITKAV